MEIHIHTPIVASNTIKVEVLGLAIMLDGEVKWVDTEIFDERKSRVSYYGDPVENLYNNPKKIDKIKSKLKEKGDRRFGSRITFAKRVAELDMSKLYDGKGKITAIRGSFVEVEEMGGQNRRGYVYYGTASPAYQGMENFAVDPDHALFWEKEI